MIQKSVPTDVDEVLVQRLRYSVTRLARLLRQQDEGGLTPTAGAMLATVTRDGPLTLGELAAQEQVAPPTVTKVITKLELAGFVDRVPDGADKRICRVVVTESGRQQLDANRSRHMAWLSEHLAALPTDDRDRVLEAVILLERLSAPGGGAS